jgi:DNA adenine methylase
MMQTVTQTAWQAPKPFVKWAGGKRKIVPLIRELMPKQFNVYHEPFVGGGALFFDLAPKHAELADINAKLINTYVAVQKDVEGVIKTLKSLMYNKTTYARIRERNFEQGSGIQRAAEFIYCNRTGFNGMYRENKNGKFNVPFGRYTNPIICDEANLRAASYALKGVGLHVEPFEKVLMRAKKGDFVYFDPPYAPISKTSNFTSFSKEGFDNEDQKRLRDVALALKARDVTVVVSNSSANIIRTLYNRREFSIREIKAARGINCVADKRGAVTELLIY